MQSASGECAMEYLQRSLLIAIMIIGMSAHAEALTIVSLAGDKDSLGTGIPVGDPVAPAYAVNSSSDGTAFDQRRSGIIEWSHQYTIPNNQQIINAALTLLTFDIEDAGAGDGQGGEPFDTRLYIDGVEVVGAFDNVYTADYSSDQLIPPNWVTFVLNSSFFPLIQDGLVTIQMADFQGGDNVWLDFAELRIETVPTAVPEPTTMLLLVLGLLGLAGMRRMRS
jgi:hypothetical protein